MKPLFLLLLFVSVALGQDVIGPRGKVGVLDNPRKVERLVIDKPGVYENYLVDSGWQGGNRVKVTCDDVIIRNCEIRNATGNGIGVFGQRVLIEKCRIHHLLAGSYEEQRDAHGITGRWGDVTIRDCEISHVSGDSIQFDPDRRSTGRVVVENCRLWTGPLQADAAKFRKGQRPGENAFDTKTMPKGPRAELVIRNTIMTGWRTPSQISLPAALNLKENVDATVTQCVFADVEVAFRLRGPTSRGGARVNIERCAIYDAKVGVRAEDGITNLRIERLGFGPKVKRKYHMVSGGVGEGYLNKGEFKAAELSRVLREGIPLRD